MFSFLTIVHMFYTTKLYDLGHEYGYVCTCTKFIYYFKTNGILCGVCVRKQIQIFGFRTTKNLNPAAGRKKAQFEVFSVAVLICRNVQCLGSLTADWLLIKVSRGRLRQF